MRVGFSVGKVARVVVAIGLMATACTSAAETPTETPNEGADTETVQARQTVQDFQIIFGMASDGPGDSIVPIDHYPDLLDRAAQGQHDAIELVNGFELVGTTSVRAQAVDAEGSVLPSISLDYALLTGPPPLMPNTGPTDSREPSPVLIQIATADLEQSFTHVGLGDRAAIDISGLPGIESVTDMNDLYLF